MRTARIYLLACLVALAGHVHASTLVDKAAMLSLQFSDARWAETAHDRLPDGPDYQRVARIAKRLAIAFAAKYGDREWTLRLVQSDAEPAAALPGNRIFVSKQALDAWTDDALAFVLAHEMGHLALGHYTLRFEKLLEVAATDGQVVTRWQDCMPYTAALPNFKKSQELEADDFGVALASAAGFDGKKGLREALSVTQDDENHPLKALRIQRTSAQ
ncbi:M48 family metallopeptidase [Paraburkholderia sp. EG287A]|uniref:M48 family metallopeptidase n=1 Tax=Paraburkholderia sp. EG287A TaxID=3237012 RepID=UPI0034D35EB3